MTTMTVMERANLIVFSTRILQSTAAILQENHISENEILRDDTFQTFVLCVRHDIDILAEEFGVTKTLPQLSSQRSIDFHLETIASNSSMIPMWNDQTLRRFSPIESCISLITRSLTYIEKRIENAGDRAS